MFSIFGKKDKKPAEPAIPPVLLAMRETLYSSPALEPTLQRLKDRANAPFPWANFVEAQQALQNGDKARAISLLKQIVETDGLETRIYLQAWHTLMSLGEQPPADLQAKIQGVVLEYHMDKGLDIVAGYADHTARYWNYSGTGIVWDARNPEIDQAIDHLLAVGQQIMNSIGAEPREPLPIPPKGNMRIFLMSYGGSSFGQGIYEQLSQDKMGGAAINAGYKLMTKLINAQKQRK